MTVADKVAATDKPVATKTATPKASARPATKTVVKAVTKAKKAAVPAKPSPTKSVVRASAKPAVKVAAVKPAKLKKPKMVRDSFTFPKAEYAVLDGLKMRAAKLGSPAKKTELLRAGIKAIAAMQDAAFVDALKSVPSLKTGRPAKAG